MFGYLRLILALFVVLSHLGVSYHYLNPGVIAVVIFYILAGYVVSHLYIKVFVHKKYRLLFFYRDRVSRIFPLYIYVITITIIFLLISSFGEPKFTLIKLIKNLTIIPLNYYMYIDSTILTSTKPSWYLIPPAWSLGTELQAYLLLPFALMFKRVKFVLAFLSFVVYIVANLSIINPDYFGYRFIVGVFFIFLIGTAIYEDTKEDRFFLVSIFLSTITLWIYFSYTNSFSPTYTRETLLGLLLGLPLVYLLSKIKIKLKYNSFFGSLSYGVFLTHFLAIWILKYFNMFHKDSYITISIAITISIILSVIGVIFIENRQV